MNYLRQLIKVLTPRKYRPRIKQICRSAFYFGNQFVCPCCNGHFRKFLTFAVKPRQNAQCPGCDSLERHRLLWLYLKDKTNFFKDNLKVLDVAPMDFFQQNCKGLTNLDYMSADISSPTAMVKMDITNTSLPDNQFDCIICYHVLEHIPDDRKAMKEMFRILKPGGWAILQSPVDSSRDETFEDPDMVSPEEQERVFGESGHIRIYGLDYKNRLEAAGFSVKLDNYCRELEDDLIKKYGLLKDEPIYFCSKPKLNNN